MAGGVQVRSIDERIVDMQFNNKQFEDGIKDSLSSLDSLKKGLGDFDNKSSGLAGIAAGIEEISNRFSTMGIIGITALQNIVNRAVDAGIQLVKSLSIEPIMEGYADYERKLTSVQTIMNATGKDIKTVSGYFDQLDEYADLTIYNLDHMTSAFAKFTNAGVDMDKSVPAIKGIANMVALAGQDANAASIAMYNLSQSIAGGFLTTMDYKSLNLANVATKEWKEQMIQGAIAAGQLKSNAQGLYNVPGAKKAYTEQQLFTEALKEGWATTEVLLKVLGDYGDVNTEIGAKAQSAAQDVKSFGMMMETLSAGVGTSWTDTFEIVLGDLEESKVLFTGLTNVVGSFLDAFADARNELLRGWKELGGRDVLINSIKNAFEGLVSAISPIVDAFHDIFPPTTAKELFALTEGLRAFTEKLKIGDDTADNLKRTFKGLFAVLDIIGQVIGFLFDKFTDLIGVFLPGTTGILAFTGGIGDLLVGLNDAIRTSDIFNKAFNTIQAAISNVVSAIKEDLKGMMETPAFQTLQSLVSKASENLKIALDNFKDVLSGFNSIDTSGLKSFTDNITNSFRPFTTIGNVLSSGFGVISKVLEKVFPVVSKLASIVGEAFKGLGEAVSEAFEGGGFQSVLSLINAGVFTAILVGIKKFVESLTGITDSAGGLLGGITGILNGVRGSLEAYQQTLKAKVLLTIATAIGILAASLVVLSLIDPNKLGVALVAITTLFVELAATMMALQKITGTVNMIKISSQMIAMSAAILILSIAMKNLAELDWDGVMKGAVGIGALAAILVTSSTALSNSAPNMIKGGTAMITMATAILILTQAVKQLAVLDVEDLGKGLIGVGVLMAEIAGFTQLVKPEKLFSTGIAMNAIGAALLIMANAVRSFGTLSIEELAKGLTSVGVLLAEIAGFTQLVKPEKFMGTGIAMIAIGAALLIMANAVEKFGSLKMEELAKGLTSIGVALVSIAGFTQIVSTEKILSTGIALIAFGAALLIIAQAVESFATMSWEELAKGLIALGGSLLIIAVGVTAMSGVLAGAAALLVVSAALLMLAPALKMLGSMDIANIGIALLALVGVFTILGVSGLLLAPLTPVILALAVAIGVLGVGVLAIGAGLLAFSAGLTALGVAGTAGAAALVVIVTSLLSLIPMAIAKLGEGVVAFAQVISKGMPAIMEAVKALGQGLVKVFIEITPEVIGALLTFIATLLEQLVDSVPQMVESGMLLILGILEGISAHIVEMVAVGLEIIAGFLEGLAEGIPGVVSAGVDVIVAFLTSIGQESPRIIDAGFKMMIDFLNGLADTLRENIPILMDAVANVADAIVDGLIQGLLNGITRVGDAAVQLGQGALDAVKKRLGIESPSKAFEEEVGSNIALGMAKGIENNSDKASKAAVKMSDQAYKSAKLWIEDYRNDTEYLVEEELKMWQILGSKYEEVSNEKIEIDKNVKKLQEKIAKDRAAAEKAEYENSVNWIAHKKKVNELSMTEEVAAWEKVQARYLEGSEERRKADEESFAAKKRLTDEQTKLTQDLQNVEQEYTNDVNERANAIAGAFGLFDELTEKEEVSSTTLVDNLKAQVEELRNWASNLQTLARKGIDEGLLAELRNMGPSANAEIRALVNGSETELTNFENLWKEKTRIAGEQAVIELESKKKEMLAKTAEINEAMAKLTDVTTSVRPATDTSDFLKSGEDSIDAVITGYDKKAPEVIATASEISSSANNEFVNAEVQFLASGEKQIGAVNKGYQSKQPDVISTVKTIIQKVLGEFESNISNFYKAGQNSINGFINGIRSKIDEVAMIAAEIAKRALEAAKRELGIESPSKEFIKIGEYSLLGFAKGFDKYSYLAEQGVADTSNTIVSSMRDAISQINDFIDFDFNMDPVITPVIDMTNVDQGIKEINDLFEKRRQLDLTGLISTTMDVSDQINRSEQDKYTQVVEKIVEKPVSFQQNNYSPKALSRLEIYRNTKNQISVLKGVLN